MPGSTGCLSIRSPGISYLKLSAMAGIYSCRSHGLRLEAAPCYSVNILFTGYLQ